jgi:hypothetical protein
VAKVEEGVPRTSPIQEFLSGTLSTSVCHEKKAHALWPDRISLLGFQVTKGHLRKWRVGRRLRKKWSYLRISKDVGERRVRCAGSLNCGQWVELERGRSWLRISNGLILFLPKSQLKLDLPVSLFKFTSSDSTLTPLPLLTFLLKIQQNVALAPWDTGTRRLSLQQEPRHLVPVELGGSQN